MVYIKKINYSHTHELSKENPAALFNQWPLPSHYQDTARHN